MDLIWDLVGGAGDWLLTALDRFTTENAFRDGFVSAVALGVVVLGLNGALNYAWSRILKFFSSTKAPPAPTVGPSPAQQIGGCFGGLVLLIVVIGVLVVFVARTILG